MAQKKVSKDIILEKEPSAPKWNKKLCPVVTCVPSIGLLGFTFDGVPCQIVIEKDRMFYGSVEISYLGDIKKDIQFKL